MTDATPRLALPLLAAGQAQKEIYHNEALIALDALVAPVALTFGDAAPPAAPEAGRSWIVGTSPTGAWAGHAGALASWTEAGWRFVAPVDGLWVWVSGAGLWAHVAGGGWSLGPLPASALIVGGHQVVGARAEAISAPGGGATIDGEARTAIAAILAALRGHGLIAT